VRRVAVVALLLLAGCALSREAALQQAAEIAQAGGLISRRLQAGPFELLAFERAGPGHGLLTVYIEGDGHAWTTLWQPSTDPTPTDPIGLRLAAADPARPLLYLARPCQFLAAAGCMPRWWTNERLSPAVVDAFQQLIEAARLRTHSDRIGLVGYSGGGALAALLAERRRDVAWLVTVAANLDLDAWVRLHGVEPLIGSLDPVGEIAALAGLPQTHFVGAEDRVVPPPIVEGFLARLPRDAPARLVVMPEFNHSCCWAVSWPRLLREAGQR
jgi:pimeloyl-ACP methyl ester carboxylesterase